MSLTPLRNPEQAPPCLSLALVAASIWGLEAECSRHLLTQEEATGCGQKQEGQVVNKRLKGSGTEAQGAVGVQERQLDLEFTSKAKPTGSEQPECGVRSREMRQSPGFWPEQLEGE